MIRLVRRHINAFLLCAAAALALAPAHVRAETTESDLQTLEMFYDGKDLATSATRGAKPISQTAENVTIVTAAEIEMMGAHTVVDVLANVSGFQVSDRGGPGSVNDFSLLGANSNHVLVMLDGVQLNSYSNAQPDLGVIPVQYIERIEIVKGPGSSAWGSALGGVVNIVTKNPNDEKTVGGTLSFSDGERGTRDTRGELSGTVDRFGYYLYGGNLTSNGFRPNAVTDQSNFFGKLRWDIPDRGALQFTLAYDRGTTGDGDTRELDYYSRFQRSYILSTLGLTYRLSESVDLDVSFRANIRRSTDSWYLLGYGQQPDIHTRDKAFGGSAKATWRAGVSTLVAGVDYDHLKTSADANLVAISTNLFSDKYGVFLNDTLTFGPLAITPGIRYDQMRPVGHFWSPSIGAAWNLDEKTVLRAYAANGYSLPILFAGATQEKVVNIQTGVETSHVPYLWLKATLFLNYLSDIQEFDANSKPYMERHRKQGFELEGKTVPILNTSLVAGYTFIDTKNRDTGQPVQELGIPRQIAKIGIHYSDQNGYRASLLGRYVWFDRYDGVNTRDKAVIWDLNLAKKFVICNDTAAEIFFTGHNLFNGAQYIWEGIQNPRRWMEGGIRFSF